ncbi:caspase family protein [Ancylomarina salipaludis]|uniref:Caspase family protein n=1 Tax=Ancylomarina salipaludis TaxID=2501299 RepID=A0A4Q1JHQ7_9BACT|nr:caspase family protein [Ancylomarina salipaludis]RXQ87393.1 caspase family protein [Ancylomarina salipaludis]
MSNFFLNIAIDNYEDKHFPPLNNAQNDALRLENILTKKYGFELIEPSLFGVNATRRNIIEVINTLAYSVNEKDNLIIYFAGHGDIHPKTKKGFWIPQDAKNSVSDWIPSSTVIDMICGIEAKHILLIIDSCFSGAFLTQNRNKIEYHYSKLNQSKSRWIISSGRHEKVSDGQPGVGSPFSVILNEFLEKNVTRTFSVAEMAIAVSKGTGSQAKQQPIFAHIEGVGHEDGQLVFNINKPENESLMYKEDSDLSKIVVSYETAIEINKLGFSQESIFGYYKDSDKVKLKICNGDSDFICSAYTYEEIVEFIPENIDVDEDTYIARSDGYDKLGESKEGTVDFASVSFQRTEVLDTPYMSICKCRGRMVAFSKNEEGYYNNLICWGRNQADSAALMIIELFKENKIERK